MGSSQCNAPLAGVTMINNDDDDDDELHDD